MGSGCGKPSQKPKEENSVQIQPESVFANQSDPVKSNVHDGTCQPDVSIVEAPPAAEVVAVAAPPAAEVAVAAQVAAGESSAENFEHERQIEQVLESESFDPSEKRSSSQNQGQVETLVAKEEQSSEQGADGPLICADKHNSDDDSQIAIDHDSTVKLVEAFEEEEWDTAVHILEASRAASKRIDVKVRTDWDQSLLRAAAESGALDVCRLLLQHRADVDAHDANNMTPLMGAAVGGDQPDIIALLLSARADAEVRTDDGFTALAWAHRLNSESKSTALLLALDPTASRYPVLSPT